MILLVPFPVRLDWWPHLSFFIWVSNWIEYFSASIYCYICCFLTMPFLYFSQFITKCIRPQWSYWYHSKWDWTDDLTYKSFFWYVIELSILLLPFTVTSVVSSQCHFYTSHISPPNALDDNDLTGTIPSEIGLLTYLEELYLSK